MRNENVINTGKLHFVPLHQQLCTLTTIDKKILVLKFK